ncbi:unnamed protein product [Paramecium sonneborni]|uniref:C2H2-type domain-containing protein n=1 Tax=Paramecium sonneborni TaxID=65129 RepID=A0A8S1REM4_9CILI|nr:unnamed protein product [Paramecium sonneborni]
MITTSQSSSDSEVRRRVKEYICGDSLCRKKYGTNAALYTHIKNKHLGVTPSGTKRPSSESIKGRKGRPQQLKAENKSQDSVTEEKIKVVKIMSTQSFQDFIYLIGQIGDHYLIRDQDEQYRYIVNEEIDKIKNDCIGDSFQLQDLHKQFMIQSSPFWKPQYFYCIYYFIIFSLSKGSFQAQIKD